MTEPTRAAPELPGRPPAAAEPGRSMPAIDDRPVRAAGQLLDVAADAALAGRHGTSADLATGTLDGDAIGR